MNSGECYQAYIALNRHFKSWDYDFFKYKGKLSGINQKSFDGRKDKWCFERMAKYSDPVGLIVSHIIAGSIWVGDVAKDAAGLYMARQKRIEGLTYLFRHELSALDSDFESNFTWPERSHPHLAKLFMAGRVSPETLAILTTITGVLPAWKGDAGLENDSVMERISRLAIKYTPFIDFDKEKFSDIVIDRFG